MKIKKLASLCAANKWVRVYDRQLMDQSGEPCGVVQWIGDGNAAYLLDGLPYLTDAQVLTLFDVPEKKRDDYSIETLPPPAGVNFCDMDEHEQVVMPEKVALVYGGATLLPVHTSRGLRFYRDEYLGPLADERESLEMYERIDADGRVYFALKAGMLIRAIVLPVQVVTQPFVEMVEGLAVSCRAVVEEE